MDTEKMLNYLNKTTLNDTYHRIIVTLFENLYKIDTLKIEKLAELCYVSPSTMTRFLQTFGFKNYSSMKNEFQMMTQQSTQILFHMYKTEQYLLKENPQKYLENYSQQISKVICQSAKYIDIQAIDQLLEDIHQHKKIYLYGYSFGKNLALTMQDNFLHLGKLCICPDTYEIQEKTIETITSQDLVIVISVYGNFIAQNQQLIQMLEQKHTKLVLLTQNKSIPAIPLFDKVITFSQENSLECGPYAMIFGVEYLIRRYHALYALSL